MMDKSETERGFGYIKFDDDYGHLCSLQMSSIATRACIWLGVNDAAPQVLVKGKGWVGYPIHEDVLLTTRMHLNQQQVRELLPHLKRFAETGEF